MTAGVALPAVAPAIRYHTNEIANRAESTMIWEPRN